MLRTFKNIIGSMILVGVIVVAGIVSPPIYALAFLKRRLPQGRFRALLARTALHFADVWAYYDRFAMNHLIGGLTFDVEIPTDLSNKKSYLILSNHASGSDIFVLVKALQGRIPFFRFFLKAELIWVPIFGLAWWALDYPFMKRYSKEYLKKFPDKAGDDKETTRKSLEEFKTGNVTIINYVEGTRYTEEKFIEQHSPYKYLLRPKAAGYSFVLEMMGDQFDGILDMTVAYPGCNPSLWTFFTGKIPVVVVKVRKLPVPKELIGKSYMNDESTRSFAQNWINNLWTEKDQTLFEIYKKHGFPPKKT